MISGFPKEKLRAVHDQDLEKLLEGLGILGKFKRGKLECKFCHRIITFNNLHSLFPQSGDIKLVCDRPKCVRTLSNLLRDGGISL